MKRLADECGYGLRPGIYCPKWASRARLEVLGVRVERLQKITAEACKAEGVLPVVGSQYAGYVKAFVHLWDEINAKRGYAYEKNPWVIVYSYKLLSGKCELGELPTEASEGGTKCETE